MRSNVSTDLFVQTVVRKLVSRLSALSANKWRYVALDDSLTLSKVWFQARIYTVRLSTSQLSSLAQGVS